MFGNCAMGRPSIETNPSRTVTIAMTMATIGRLMKKEAMARPDQGFTGGVAVGALELTSSPQRVAWKN